MRTHLLLGVALMLAACSPQGESKLQGYGEATYLYVAPQEGGVIASLNVKEGDRVEAGAVVATLDGAPENLWMTGILNDADRDAQSHQRGPLLDTALIGALRKAKAAEIVSIETAMALAASEAPAMMPALTANHAEDRAVEMRLARLLGTIGGHIPVI